MAQGITKEELRQREQQVTNREQELGGSQEDIFAAIAFDRVERWKAVVAQISIPTQIQQWAAAMAAAYNSPTVQIWRETVDWITALLVARYGEAEYHWPDALGDEDIRRARAWARGKLPEGVAWAIKQKQGGK